MKWWLILLAIYFIIYFYSKEKEPSNTNNENYWKIIKKNKKNEELCFIHTPKCGGSYAGEILRDLGIKNKGHHRAEKNDGITFTIIRDPVERFESLINYRLGETRPRNDWPESLDYVYNDDSITLNEIVSKMSDEEIVNFLPYRTLAFWSSNVDIFITIDTLYNFLSFFGYNYSVDKYKKINVSSKKRGTFNESTKDRIAQLYADDMILYERWVR